jgi:hypothetical protein
VQRPDRHLPLFALLSRGEKRPCLLSFLPPLLLFLSAALSSCGGSSSGPERSAVETASPIPYGEETFRQYALCALGDRIFVGGGETDSTEEFPVFLDAVYAYACGERKWRVESPMEAKRAGHTFVTLEGDLYALGGFVQTAPESVLQAGSVDRYDPETEAWSYVCGLPHPIRDFGAAAWNGRIVVAGGRYTTQWGVDATVPDVVEVDPAARRCRVLAGLSSARTNPVLAVIDDTLVAVGGFLPSGEWTAIVQKYDPGADAWSAPLPGPSVEGATASGDALSGRFYLASASTIRRFDPAAGTWATMNARVDGECVAAGARLHFFSGKAHRTYDPDLDAELR